MKKNHLTEKELIEYQFKLCSEKQTAEAAEHLKECEKCRKLNERLAAKFSALAILREDVEVTEELVSKVLENIKAVRSEKVRTFKIPAWIGAAAAVIMIGSLLMIADLNKRSKSSGKFAAETKKEISSIERGREDSHISKFRDRRARAEVVAESKAVTLGEKAIQAAGIYKEKEKPPFAPASAIELVTLPRRDNVQITIYNSADLTLVRERRNLTLKRGWNWLQFMWANTLIDPTSLNLEPLKEKDKIDIEQLVFPPRLKELGRWLIHSEIEGQVPFEITYFTSGLSWRAFYMGTLTGDEKTMRLQGYVRVTNNSGEDYEDTQTRLIVGKVHLLDKIAELARQEFPYGRPFAGYAFGGYGGGYGGFADDKGVPLLGNVPIGEGSIEKYFRHKKKEIVKEGLSEYFLYTIEGTETIEDKWGKRLLSFEANEIDVNSLYKYDEDRYGKNTIRFVSFVNDEAHNLGQTPIPNGNVKIYSVADSEGYLSYVGGADIKYIPVNEEVELNLGRSNLVKIEPALMEFSTENYRYDKDRNISGWDEIRGWKIEVSNTRELPIEVEITRGFGTTYWDIEIDDEGVNYKKHDAERARFTLTVQPRSKKVFEYTVRTYHGIRQEEINL